jgi:hypothetical protein
MNKANLKTKATLALLLAALPLLMQSVLAEAGPGLPGFRMEMFDFLDLPLGMIYASFTAM